MIRLEELFICYFVREIFSKKEKTQEETLRCQPWGFAHGDDQATEQQHPVMFRDALLYSLVVIQGRGGYDNDNDDFVRPSMNRAQVILKRYGWRFRPRKYRGKGRGFVEVWRNINNRTKIYLLLSRITLINIIYNN